LKATGFFSGGVAGTTTGLARRKIRVPAAAPIHTISANIHSAAAKWSIALPLVLSLSKRQKTPGASRVPGFFPSAVLAASARRVRAEATAKATFFNLV
jgi:hypothetical protein